MIEKSIENFIINACYSDVLDYRKQAIPPIVEDYEKNQWSYIVETMIIAIKSLKPSEKENGNIIDYDRFKHELELWKSYRHGMNRNLLYSIEDKPYEKYFIDIDESIYARVAVITLANQNWEAAKSEIIKNTLFTSGNIEIILECLLLSRLLFLTVEDKNYEYDNILADLKNEAINFSQEELEEYDEYYRSSKSNYKKNYKIEFERMRINLISLLNEIEISNNFSTLKMCLEFLKDQENYEFEEDGNFFIAGFIGMLNKELESNEIKDIRFLESLCNYILKLRKGRIDLDDLKLRDYKSSDIFDYKEGIVFSHPLLNKSQIIYKGEREGFEVAYVKTQTGIYRFINLERN